MYDRVKKTNVFLLAYTIYAFFEWSLIFYDIAFDAVTSLNFENFDVNITRRKGDKWQEDKEIV